MRALTVLVALLGCSSGGRSGQSQATPSLRPAAAVTATAIAPVELAGPYRSLADSCKAAPPCGFTATNARGDLIDPPTEPECDAVLDPSTDIVGRVPDSIGKTGERAAMTHRSGSGEVRIGGVICAEPEPSRGERSMYYVFVHRSDGWWRTRAAMFTYGYNTKYCAGGLYITWNDRSSGTIAGIAAEANCLTCYGSSQSSSIVELMLRVEPAGDRPAVFPLLPVGYRQRTERLIDQPYNQADPDCGPSSSAMSLRETWPAEDVVVLDGATGPSVSGVGVRTLSQLAGDGTIRPGRYRFTR